jgi:hypothetical protein
LQAAGKKKSKVKDSHARHIKRHPVKSNDTAAESHRLTPSEERLVRKGLDEIKEGKFKTFPNADALLTAIQNDDD